MEVLFGVGFGGGDAVKRFVEDAHDPPLFGERWQGDWKRRELSLVDVITVRVQKAAAVARTGL